MRDNDNTDKLLGRHYWGMIGFMEALKNEAMKQE